MQSHEHQRIRELQDERDHWKRMTELAWEHTAHLEKWNDELTQELYELRQAVAAKSREA